MFVSVYSIYNFILFFIFSYIDEYRRSKDYFIFVNHLYRPMHCTNFHLLSLNKLINKTYPFLHISYAFPNRPSYNNNNFFIRFFIDYFGKCQTLNVIMRRNI